MTESPEPPRPESPRSDPRTSPTPRSWVAAAGDAAPAWEIVARTPTPDEYLRLRAAAGLSAFSADAAREGLRGTRFAALAMREGRAVGMARLVGDGGCFFQIVDVAVDPAHQGAGVGSALMAAVMAHVESALPKTAYVSLIADRPADRLYARFGFAETAPASVGMAFRVG